MLSTPSEAPSEVDVSSSVLGLSQNIQMLTGICAAQPRLSALELEMTQRGPFRMSLDTLTPMAFAATFHPRRVRRYAT